MKELKHLIQMMHNHSAWFSEISGKEAEEILKPYPLHTFLLRTGEDELHYFCSYVAGNSLVFHKSIRINAEALGYYPNGGVGCNPNKIYGEIEPLISEFLGCHKDDLQPLLKQLSQVQDF